MKFACFAALLTACTTLSSAPWIHKAEDITEEWLIEAGEETGYTEHVRHFKRLFKNFDARDLLEFGCGFSTKYFMDNCKKVISVEFVTPGTGPEWLQYCIKLYKNCKNWTPIAYFSGNGLDMNWAPNKYIGKDSVYAACSYQPVHYKSYAPIDASFLDDLDAFVKKQVNKNSIDVAFVDCGVCIRGDLVQVLFQKVPIIVAHDISPKSHRHTQDVYGYGRVQAPENYVEVYIPFGMGTAFWIKDEPKYQSIIKDLQKYAASKN